MKTLTLLAVTASCLVLAATAQAASPVVNGSVGPGFTITLKKKGKAVKSLAPGKYRLVIADKSSIHNFELEGPGVKKVETDVSATGSKQFTINLQKGTYTFYCKPHRSTMHGTFKVK